MLKRYLLASLCLLCCTIHTWPRKEKHPKKGASFSTTPVISKKAEYLPALQAIADQLNRTNPLNGYIVTVPSFVILTSEDIYQFLAGIPQESQKDDKPNKKRPRSMLDHLRQLWREVIQATKGGTLTQQTRELLEQMREALEDAFKHDITYIRKKPIASFIKQCTRNDIPLIIRSSIDHALLTAKTICPVKPADLNQAIGMVIKSYYYAETIEQLLAQGPLSPDLYASVIMQTLVMADKMEDKREEPVVSGVSCSYDTTTQMPGIITIESIYHHGKALKDPTVARDHYYVHDDMVYPIIMKKTNCYEPDFQMNTVHIIHNRSELQTTPSLECDAVKKIAHATKFIEEHYEQPVCVSFIKRDHTIYLVKLHLPTVDIPEKSTYIDPLYVKKAVKDDAVSIAAIKPIRDTIILKHRTEIISAPTFELFLTKLAKREDNRAVIGIVKQPPSEWSKEKELLDELDIPMIWSNEYEHIQSWIKEKRWPLIIDPQQQLMFPFKRRKGFCTLFQTIENGIKERPPVQHLSVIPSFIEPLHEKDRKPLTPYEFFSGVSMEQLIELTKHAEKNTAIQALRSILYRLSNEIKHRIISQRELQEAKQPYDPLIVQKLQEIYEYIEQVAHQIYKILPQDINAMGQQPKDQLERLFLVNMINNLIMQKSSDDVMHATSFNAITF